MAKDRAHDPKRVFPISHVNVLPNVDEATYDNPHGSGLEFRKNRNNKPFSDASGVSKLASPGRYEYQTAEVYTRGATGHSGDDYETANEARKDAYNDASSKAVNTRKEITKKGAENIEKQNKTRGKAKVIKINSDPAQGIRQSSALSPTSLKNNKRKKQKSVYPTEDAVIN